MPERTREEFGTSTLVGFRLRRVSSFFVGDARARCRICCGHRASAPLTAIRSRRRLRCQRARSHLRGSLANASLRGARGGESKAWIKETALPQHCDGVLLNPIVGRHKRQAVIHRLRYQHPVKWIAVQLRQFCGSITDLWVMGSRPNCQRLACSSIHTRGGAGSSSFLACHFVQISHIETSLSRISACSASSASRALAPRRSGALVSQMNEQVSNSNLNECPTPRGRRRQVVRTHRHPGVLDST